MDSKEMKKHMVLSCIGVTMIVVLVGLTGVALAKDWVKENVILNQFTTISTVASTVPANGDLNPYGVAEVQQSIGSLVAGHILVSNFNNSNNLQGTGSTIVDVAPNGTVKLFAQINANQLPGFCPGGVGLTTALVVLRSG